MNELDDILLATSDMDIRMPNANVPRLKSQNEKKPIIIISITGAKRDWQNARFALRDDLEVFPYGWLRKGWLISSTGVCGSPAASFPVRKIPSKNIYIQVHHIYRTRKGFAASEERWVRITDLLHKGMPLGPIDSDIERARRGLQALHRIQTLAHPL